MRSIDFFLSQSILLTFFTNMSKNFSKVTSKSLEDVLFRIPSGGLGGRPDGGEKGSRTLDPWRVSRQAL